jgi:ADP-ribose pyrophosphatase YjhB (NUDIX family)
MRPRSRKVIVYVTYDRKLLMFRHTQHPEAGIQVPAGTIKLGEEPLAAAIPELAEESGLADAAVEFGEMLGTFEFDMLPYRTRFRSVSCFMFD